jgi:release factor H-coupled RctB family protein
MDDKVIIVCKEEYIDPGGLNQLYEAMKKHPDINQAVVMPDIHEGPGIPIGVCFTTQNVIYPKFIGTDIGCGMTLFSTNIKVRKNTPEQLAKKLKGGIEYKPRKIYADSSWDHNFDEDLGTLGGGNHFAEFLEVDEVEDPQEFSKLGIDETKAVLLVHSGSRRYGGEIAKTHDNILSNEKQQQEYISDHDKAVSWALANREQIAIGISDTVGTSSERILNVVHNYLEVKNDGNSHSFLHRKGVGRVNPGDITVIPGSRGSATFLVKMTENKELAEKMLCSVAHGAGRKLNRTKAKEKFGHLCKEKLERTSVGSTVVCSNISLLRQEHELAYKDIYSVVQSLVDAGLVSIVAKLKPLCTFKD